MRKTGIIVLVAPATLLVACNEPFSNDDLLFLKAIPTRQQVGIDVPQMRDPVPVSSTSTSTAEPRPITAQYYEAAREISAGLNEATFFVLDVVEVVAREEPTVREDNRRIWGPFPVDDKIEVMMTIDRVLTSTVFKTTSTSTQTEVDHYFNYQLEARAIGTERWFVYFAGRFAPSQTLEEGMGAIYLNLEAAREVDQSSSDRGLFFIGYDNRFEQVTIEVIIDSVVEAGSPFAEVEGGYHYEERPNGNKAFFFAIKQDIPEIQPNTGPELLVISARWLADNTGRADVAATQGDLGSVVYFVSECWDAEFRQTFLLANIPGVLPVGTVSSCAEELRESVFEK